MRKLYLLAAMLFCGLFAQAQNIEVFGYQHGTWDADTVFVTGNVSVRDSLHIQAGTTVVFQGYYGIRVHNGTFIKAIGTETDSITFTVRDTTGFHLYNLGRGGWNGIHLDDARASRFDYCRFEYGKAALDNDQDGGALRITGCDDVEITHSTLFCNFSREHGGALNAVKSKVVVHDCDVRNNMTYTKLDTVYFMYGGGMRFINCDVELVETNFRYNIGESAIGGALSLDSCAVMIDRCKFEHNYGINGSGLYLIRSNDYPCSISNSLFANNTSGHFGGGLAISDSSPELSNLTVVNNLSVGVNCGGIFFYQYSMPIVRNCIVYGNENATPIEEPVQIWAWTFDNYAPRFYNCLVQYGFENISGNDAIWVYENCLDADPLFVDPDNENYHIGDDSPCFNSGWNHPDDFDKLDLDGNARVWDNLIDLGAYEFSNVGVEEIVQTSTRLRVVGNPITSSSYAEIECEKVCNLFAKVYSADGKLLVDKSLGNVQTGLNRIALGEMFASLPSGAYVLTFKTEGRTFVASIWTAGVSSAWTCCGLSPFSAWCMDMANIILRTPSLTFSPRFRFRTGLTSSLS